MSGRKQKHREQTDSSHSLRKQQTASLKRALSRPQTRSQQPARLLLRAATRISLKQAVALDGQAQAPLQPMSALH